MKNIVVKVGRKEVRTLISALTNYVDKADYIAKYRTSDYKGAIPLNLDPSILLTLNLTDDEAAIPSLAGIGLSLIGQVEDQKLL